MTRADDVVAAQSLTLICEEVDTWKVYLVVGVL